MICCSIEGYKHYPMPKIEVYREANGKPLLHTEDPHIVAIAADVPVPTKLPRFDLDEYDRIAAFILTRGELKR